MAFEAKWLDILKATSPQTTAIAAACALFLFFPRWGLIPPLEPWATHVVVLALLVCSSLSVASIGTALYTFFPADKWVWFAINNWRLRRNVRNYIPYTTEKERQIIGYLLEKNQKSFTAASDGGHAATLLARGIVCYAAQRGQIVRERDVPMFIPDPVWNVLAKHRERFPYKPEYDDSGKDETHPWRVHWMTQ